MDTTTIIQIALDCRRRGLPLPSDVRWQLTDKQLALIEQVEEKGVQTMQDQPVGDRNEVLEQTEQEVHDLEQRITQSRYKELSLWKDHENFTIDILPGKGRWRMWTPKETYFGDSIEEVLNQAQDTGYPVYEWLSEFNDR